MSWEDLAVIMNSELRGTDEPRWDSSVYRKRYRDFARAYENIFSKIGNDAEYQREMQNKIDELYKEKRKFYDQRREYNKNLVTEARAEHLNEELIRVAQSLNESTPIIDPPDFKADCRGDISETEPKEAVLFLSDWHYGMVTDNIWNKYDTEICVERVNLLLGYVVKYIRMNNIRKLYIVLLGDAAHGACHVSCRVASEEDVCDQIMKVSEIIAEVINYLSQCVPAIDVYSCYGNHLRTIQNKKDSLDSDNMEKLIPWWISARLADNDKVKIITSEYKEFIKFNVFDYNICCVHGNLDNFKALGTTVNTIFSRKYGETIDYTVSGDRHHLEEFEQFDIESILIRSLCGTDEYANNKRLYSKPGQTLIVFNPEYGREATYHIPLDGVKGSGGVSI